MSTGRGRTAPLFATLGMLYFAQGLPAGLLGKSLPALARDAGLSPEWIGLLALPALPWALKFIWAPWVDRWGSGRPNHRKRWILVCLTGVMSVLTAAAMLPQAWLFGAGFAVLIVMLFLLNLFSATQDIATDGLAARLLTPRLRGLGNSVQVSGYKVGMILGSGALLILVGWLGWQATLFTVIAMLLLVALTAWRFDEPLEPVRPRKPVTLRWWLRQLALFWRRPGLVVWLVILLGYKVGDGFGTRMIKPFLVDSHWTLAEIGTLDLVASLVGLAGAGLAGLIMMRLSRRVALFGFAGLQALSFIGWWWVASWGADTPPAEVWIWAVALFEQLADGLSTVALFVVMMDYCRAGHEGSDYTVQASVQLFAVGAFTLASGFSVAWLGYASHFLLAAALSAAVIGLAAFWTPPTQPEWADTGRS